MKNFGRQTAMSFFDLAWSLGRPPPLCVACEQSNSRAKCRWCDTAVLQDTRSWAHNSTLGLQGLPHLSKSTWNLERNIWFEHLGRIQYGSIMFNCQRFQLWGSHQFTNTCQGYELMHDGNLASRSYYRMREDEKRKKRCWHLSHCSDPMSWQASDRAHETQQDEGLRKKNCRGYQWMLEWDRIHSWGYLLRVFSARNYMGFYGCKMGWKPGREQRWAKHSEANELSWWFFDMFFAEGFDMFAQTWLVAGTCCWETWLRTVPNDGGMLLPLCLERPFSVNTTFSRAYSWHGWHIQRDVLHMLAK